MSNRDFSELNQIEGLQFIPVNNKKMPTIKNWQTEKCKHDLSKAYGVGLVCGDPSGNLEAIDIDQKYSLDGKLYENYKNLIASNNPDLLRKMVVQKTKNGGFHFLYRCSTIQGNIKLANRYTTDKEKKETYDAAYKLELLKEGSNEEKAKSVADKTAKNDKVRVLIETRGQGGQVVCFPSEGYEIIYGDFYSIHEITIEERETLFDIARQLNEVVEEIEVPKKAIEKKGEGLSPFEDYDERGDVVGLLESFGWRVVSQKGQKTIFLRPGQTTAQSSGNYDHTKQWFSVFTTSTEFDPQRAYRPYAVFAVLECNKDFTAAAKKLVDLGYGEKKQSEKKEYQSTRVIQSRINTDDEDLSFLAIPEDYNEYLKQVRDGTLPMGLTTGIPSLDEHFLFKNGNFVMVNGTDNVGKTKFVWYLQLLSAMYHGWCGVVFASENTLGSFMRAMMQFYWGKPLRGHNAMSDAECKIARDFIESHFWQIKAQEDLYNYKDILNMIKKTRKKYPKINHAMIDPYNSLKIDLSGFSKLNTHEYHYEALSEMKAYGQQTSFGFFINHHAVTAAARAKDGEKKYPVAPGKADTESGAKVSNKADDFLTIHRITQHPTDWNITEVHVRKIKDTETGGRPTPLDMPVKLEMYRNSCGFFERLEMGGRPVDPIQKWHELQQPKQSELTVVYTNDFLNNLPEGEDPFPYIK
jgi:hypothetical protein